MHHSSVSWEITLLYFFSWNFIWFLQKKPIKVQNFRKILTAQVKFHQICTLIGSFCWKYIKFQLKKYRGVMSHDTEEWCKIWRKTDLLFQKWQEFGEFWSEHSILQNLHCDLSLLRKVYNIWPKNVQRSLSLMILKTHAKFEEKLACSLENDTRNLANFHQNIGKCQNWYFHGIILSKVENTWAKNLQTSYV